MSTDSIRKIVNDDKLFNSMTDELIGRIDIDGSGEICQSELKTLLTEFSHLLEIPLPKDSDIEDIFTGIDVDGSGVIDSKEFKRFLKGFLNRMSNILDDKTIID